MPNLIELKQVDIGYTLKRQTKVLISGLNISAQKGELIALLGINGAGKSTLLKTLAKAIAPLAGNLKINNIQADLYKPKDFAKTVSFVPAENLRPENMRVEEFIAFGRFPYTGVSGFITAADKTIIDAAIRNAKVEHLTSKQLTKISSGEFQKVLIARSLAQDTPIILLDEPASFLDIDNKHSTFNLLRKIVDTENKTIVFSAHDLATALKIADKIWLIKNKKIIQGAPEDLFLNNTFQNFFPSKLIKFDTKLVDFKVEKKCKYPIYITRQQNCNDALTATKHCLKRTNFYVSETKTPINLEIYIKNNKFAWKLNQPNNSTLFFSVYELSKALKEIKNND